AAPIAAGTNGPFSNQFATDGPPPGAGCPAGAGDVWFTFAAQCAGPHTITTCGTGYDTVIALLAGCGPGATVIACNDDDPSGACGAGSAITFQAAAGATYFLRVA